MISIASSSFRELINIPRFSIFFLRTAKNPYRIFLHKTARPGDLAHSAVGDFLLGDARPLATGVDLILRERAETVVPLHTVGPVGLPQGLVTAIEVLAKAQTTPDRLQAAVYRCR